MSLHVMAGMLNIAMNIYLRPGDLPIFPQFFPHGRP